MLYSCYHICQFGTGGCAQKARPVEVLTHSRKCNLYKSMVRPIIEFASPVWDPHTALHVNKIESIQRSAVRFCFNNNIILGQIISLLC